MCWDFLNEVELGMLQSSLARCCASTPNAFRAFSPKESNARKAALVCETLWNYKAKCRPCWNCAGAGGSSNTLGDIWKCLDVYSFEFSTLGPFRALGTAKDSPFWGNPPWWAAMARSSLSSVRTCPHPNGKISQLRRMTTSTQMLVVFPCFPHIFSLKPT